VAFYRKKQLLRA